MEIRTERLTMRPHCLDDFAASAKLWADDDVVRHITGRPSTREESWGRLLRYIGQWQALGFGYWVVSETASGAFVGEVGFGEYHREIEPPLEGIPELGWVVMPAAQGKGYATEAVRAAISWAQEHLAATRTACIIDPENRVSIRVAEKCGFRFVRETTYRGQPTLLFERDLAGEGQMGIE